jgi:putative aldouronate transport system permease protein
MPWQDDMRITGSSRPSRRWDRATLAGRTADILIYAVLAVVALLSVLPVLNTVAISFSKNSLASAGIVTFYPLGFTLESYKRILDESAFFNAFRVSVERVILSTTLSFFITILAAYPLSKSRDEFKARKYYVLLLVFTMMFWPALIPWYLTIRKLHLTGTILALVLPGAVSQFLIIMVINYFRSLPKALDESASMDGAGPWYKLFRIFVPLSTPVLATVVLFIVVWNWNSFFDGLILMNRTEQYPLQTYIQQLVAVVNPNLQNPSQIEKLKLVSQRTLNASKIVVTMLPILLLYPFLQRYFIKGIMLGSLKE